MPSELPRFQPYLTPLDRERLDRVRAAVAEERGAVPSSSDIFRALLAAWERQQKKSAKG